MDPCGGQGGQAPQDGACNDQWLAREPVTEPTCGRRSEHVEDEERGCQPSDLLIRRMKLSLDERDFARKDVAVDVIEQIQGNEQHQRDSGRADAGANRIGRCRQGKSGH